MKARLEEIGTLPGMLATAQKNLEKEKLDKVLLENELQSLTADINTLVWIKIGFILSIYLYLCYNY